MPKEFHYQLSKSSVFYGAREIVVCTRIESGEAGKTNLLFNASYCVDDKLRQRRSGSEMDKPRIFVVGLPKSMAQVASIVRHRRLGCQSFIHSSSKATVCTPKRYHSCAKFMNVLRVLHYCQLCGHRTCAACVDILDVEAKLGVLRTNCVCNSWVQLPDCFVFDDLRLDLLGCQQWRR